MAALGKIRMFCAHPDLADEVKKEQLKTFIEQKQGPVSVSSKIAAIGVDTMKFLVEDDTNKILIFSQWTR